MKISIITVCFNSRSTIEDTIQSISSQNYQDIEYIIIDGSSNDGTVSLIKEHADKVTKWSSEPDKGIYDAMNKGIGMASGDIIGFLNADDLYADCYVLEKVAGIFKDFTVDACYADLVYVDPVDLNKVVRYIKSCDYVDGLFRKGWCPPHPTFFVKKSIYQQYGGFDLSYAIGNDVELMIRFLGRHKISTVYFPEILVRMRTGGVSNSSFLNIIRQNIEILKAMKRNGINVSPASFFISKFFSRLSQFYSRPNLIGCI